MNGIQRIAKIFMKIMEIGHWVAAGLMGAVGILSAAAPQWLKFVMDVEALKEEREISVYGFEVTAANSAGQINYVTLLLLAIGGVIIYVLMALVFRSLNRIITTAADSTPFQESNIRMLTWIGRFCILIPVIGFVMSIIIRLVVGADAVEISIDQSGVVMGIVVLCLTQYFVHGAKLEKEVDGLL